MSFGLGAQQTAATWRCACGHESVPPVSVSSKRLKSDLFRNKWILPSYDECHRGGLFLSCDVISCWASWLSLCLREFLRCDSSGHVTMGNRWAYKGQQGWGRPKAGSRPLRWGREGRGKGRRCGDWHLCLWLQTHLITRSLRVTGGASAEAMVWGVLIINWHFVNHVHHIVSRHAGGGWVRAK